MKKRILVLVALLAVLASGCITIRLETKIKEDGSGTQSMALALDKGMMSLFESMAQESGGSVDDLWAEARVEAERIPGAKVEDYSEENAEGIKVTIPFKDLDELATLSGNDALGDLDTVTVSQDGDTRTLKVVLSGSNPLAGLSQAGGEGMEEFDLEEFDLGDFDLTFTYAVDVEGKILSYSPQDIAKVKGSKVTWDLMQADADQLELTLKWEPGSSGGGSNMLPLLVGVVAIGGVLLVIVGVVMTMRRPQSSDRFTIR